MLFSQELLPKHLCMAYISVVLHVADFNMIIALIRDCMRAVVQVGSMWVWIGEAGGGGGSGGWSGWTGKGSHSHHH